MNIRSISRALPLFGAALIWLLVAAAAVAATDSLPSSDAMAPDAIITVPLADTDILPTEYNGDLRDLQQVTYSVPRYLHMWNDFAEPRSFKPPVVGTNEPAAAVISLAPMPAPSKNFAGIGFSDSVPGTTHQAGFGWPPDTNGDVGPTVYIQAVNDTFGIFDKATGSRVTAFTEDQLWSVSGLPSSNPCFSNNQGDPVVLHDGLADRWILTNFGFAVDGGGNPVAPFYQCIAVSKTGDPVGGGWWFYPVQMDTGGAGKPPANTFNDYGKFGVWTDCLYEGANGFNNATGNYAGAIFAAFSRTAIFAGQALSSTNSSIGFICSGTDVNGCTGPFTMIPANLLGISAASQPPSGTPEYFIDESNSAFAFDVRKFVQGATVCGAGSTLGASTTVTQTSYLYNANDYVPQKNTTNKLDPLENRLMQKVQYRKVGSAESLWVVHTVGDGTTTTAQPQWAQINVTNKTIATTPVQQQIYAPDTTLYRWMGSLAVDGHGNMALGYSTSSATAFPSIAYSGRLVADTLNQLPQSETPLVAGAGSQTNKDSSNTFISRWGDYSAMSMDPADDCTFWYTNEYYDTQAHGTAGNWQTRIGAFRFPGCIGPATKLEFSVQPNSTYASGGTITVKVSVEDFNGNVVTSDTSAVTLALSGGTGGAVLSGTKTVNAVAGVATFSNLSVDKIGTNYVLNATDGSLTSTASTAFNITVGAAKTVTFTTQPATNSNVAAGATIPLVAHVVDVGGNPVPSQSITLSILNNAGSSTLSVTTNPVATNASGDATFANVSLNKVGTGYTLKATDTTTLAATPATSNAFNIVAGAATKLVFTTQATNVNAGHALNTIGVQEEDAFGNFVNGNGNVDFTVPACGGSIDLGSAVMVNGAASLTSSKRFYTVTSNLHVTATATAANGTSTAFSVVAGDMLFSDSFDGCRL